MEKVLFNETRLALSMQFAQEKVQFEEVFKKKFEDTFMGKFDQNQA